MYFIASSFLFTLFMLFCEIDTTIVSDTASEPKLICYYITWVRYYKEPMNHTPEDMPTDLCDFLVYFKIKMNPETFKVASLDKNGDYTLEGFKGFVALKDNGPTVLLGVGGYGDSLEAYTNMSSHAEHRKIFITNLVKFMKYKGFQGLLFDWSYPGEEKRGGAAEDKTNFVTLLEELKAAFQANDNLILAITGPDTETQIDAGYDVPEISRIVDQILVKAYDLNGNWNPYVDTQSPLYSDKVNKDNNVRHLMNVWISKGAPRNKLYLGVGSITAVSMTLNSSSATAIGSPAKINKVKGPYSNTKGYLTYSEVCGYLMTGQWNKSWDNFGRMPFAVNGNQWISYEDPKSVAEKAAFVRTTGLGGIFLYGSSFDDFRGLCGEKYPLTKSIRREFKKP